MKNNMPWWSEKYGFFGNYYILGDNSKEGYRINQRQTLEQRTLTEVEGVIKLLGLTPKSKILDIPCGYGRHSIELAKRGFKVTGVDLNNKHLSIAKKLAVKNSVLVKFKKENMLDLKRDSEFDAVLNLFFSFGFFKKEKDNFKVLKNFYRALRPNGQFLMHTDVNIPFIKAGKYQHDEVRILANGFSLRIIDKYNSLTERIDGAWIIKDRNGKEIKKAYSVRVYAKDEFIQLCKRAGFKSCAAYSGWRKEQYSKEKQDMIIVARK
jgi:SAM-dependent methyltransferase